MELRSFMNTRPGVTVGICAAVVVAAGIILFARGGTGINKVHVVNRGDYYTADDGQTWIADVWTQVPPFERDGKTYVRLHMFEDGKNKKVGYLEKYSDEARNLILAQEDPHDRQVKLNELGFQGLLVKKPGEADWVPRDSSQGLAIVQVMSPDGRGQAKPSFPEIP